MIILGFSGISALFLGLALYISPTISHLDSRFADVSPLYETFHDSVYARDAEENQTFHDAVFSRSHAELKRRGLYYLAGNNAADTSILQQGFLDMVDVVTHSAKNPNDALMARYFRGAGDAAQVTRVFDTVLKMAQAGGYPDPPGYPGGRLSQTDLSQITVVRSSEVQLVTLAESFNLEAKNALDPTIKIYNFGWNALWQRLRQNLQCGRDIGPKTNYKMHFLGTLMLHETLHFKSVSFLAGFGISQFLDDQAGSFPCTGLAYGPWEAIQLRERHGALALLNIENYVWYALENYWGNECGTTFAAPGNNDIPAVCKQGLKGAASNLWCWKS